jgi:hypothetical protein
LRNLSPTADFQSITIDDDLPNFVQGATVSIIPASVAADGSALAAIDFQVSSSALVGEVGSLTLTISGVRSAEPIDIVLTVPLEVTAAAPIAQGVVGTGVPAPDPGGLDTDGDGVTDALELNFGTDPLDSNSVPGKPQPPAVPSIRPILLGGLITLLLVIGSLTLRRRVRGEAR